jgi:hypothetical protein
MREPGHGLDRRSFLRVGLGAALILPAAGALAALAGCGSDTRPSAPPAPGTSPSPAAASPQKAAAAPSGPATAPDALVDQIPANASLVASLQYESPSPVAEQLCAGCQLYTAVSEGRGKCVLFVEGLVAARGHCTSWVKKQA